MGCTRSGLAAQADPAWLSRPAAPDLSSHLAELAAGQRRQNALLALIAALQEENDNLERPRRVYCNLTYRGRLLLDGSSMFCMLVYYNAS